MIIKEPEHFTIFLKYAYDITQYQGHRTQNKEHGYSIYNVWATDHKIINSLNGNNFYNIMAQNYAVCSRRNGRNKVNCEWYDFTSLMNH